METVISEVIEAPQDSTQQQNDQKQNSIKHQLILLNDTEELLGSVTTFPKTAGSDGPAVRTSARVIHKLRMDSTPLPQNEKKEAQSETSTVTQPKTPSQTKPHVKVQWTNEERSFFFDAINEHGRDFEQISRFINSKMRRKTPIEPNYKTKDHIRQNYYQIYQKASKYIKFSEDVKKHAQELYTIINFGEMKRKLVMMTEKSFLKFRDLVYKGSVMIRWKGKNIKIKTPSCRALKRLNQLEGNTVDDIQLPLRIDVSLRPANSKSFGYVQSLAQNPRVRMMSLPLQRRVASLLITMQQKWQTNNTRLYDKYVNSYVQRYGAQKIGEDVVAHSLVDNAQLKKEEPNLCFMPPPEAIIHRPMVQLNELLSTYNLCLNSYEDRIGAKTRGESLCSDMSAQIKEILKHPSKRMRFDSASDIKKIKVEEVKVEEIKVEVKEIEEPGIAIIDHKSNDSMEPELKKIDEKSNDEEKKEEPEEVLHTLLAPTLLPQVKMEEDVKLLTPVPTTTTTTTTTPTTTKYKKKDQLNGVRMNKEQPFKPLIDEEMLKKIRSGWSLANVGDLTIGDLYLMFGSDSKLVLEYDAVGCKEPKPESNGETNECRLSSKKLGNKLKCLVSIASLMESVNNPLLSGYLSNHPCERLVNDNGEHQFKTPIPNCLAPRAKAPQARWRQRMRPLGGPFTSGISGQHVVREVYQTPPAVERELSKAQSDNNNKGTDKYEDVTKIIDAKILGLTEKDAINGFSETSSMKSFLDCLDTNRLVRSNSNISEGEKNFFTCEPLINFFFTLRIFILNETA